VSLPKARDDGHLCERHPRAHDPLNIVSTLWAHHKEGSAWPSSSYLGEKVVDSLVAKVLLEWPVPRNIRRLAGVRVAGRDAHELDVEETREDENVLAPVPKEVVQEDENSLVHVRSLPEVIIKELDRHLAVQPPGSVTVELSAMLK